MGRFIFVVFFMWERFLDKFSQGLPAHWYMLWSQWLGMDGNFGPLFLRSLSARLQANLRYYLMFFWILLRLSYLLVSSVLSFDLLGGPSSQDSLLLLMKPLEGLTSMLSRVATLSISSFARLMLAMPAVSLLCSSLSDMVRTGSVTLQRKMGLFLVRETILKMLCLRGWDSSIRNKHIASRQIITPHRGYSIQQVTAHKSVLFERDRGGNGGVFIALWGTAGGVDPVNASLVDIDQEDDIQMFQSVPSLKYMSLLSMGMVTMNANRSSSKVLTNLQRRPRQLRCSTLLRRQLMQSWGVIMMNPKMAMKATAVQRRKGYHCRIEYPLECRAHQRQTAINGTNRQFRYHTAQESIFSLFLYNQLASSLNHGKLPPILNEKVREIFQIVTPMSTNENPITILLELCSQTQSVRMAENTNQQNKVLSETPLLFQISFQKRYSCLTVKNLSIVCASESRKKAATRQTWLVNKISFSSSMEDSSMPICIKFPIGPILSNIQSGCPREQKAANLMTSQGKICRVIL